LRKKPSSARREFNLEKAFPRGQHSRRRREEKGRLISEVVRKNRLAGGNEEEVKKKGKGFLRSLEREKKDLPDKKGRPR